jgi:hypothetical protein
VSVLYIISCRGLIGKVISSATLKCAAYLSVLQENSVSSVNPQVFRVCNVQQDGTPQRDHIKLRDFLKVHLPGRRTESNAMTQYPSRSPDLTRLDVSMKRALKNSAVMKKNNTPEHVTMY